MGHPAILHPEDLAPRQVRETNALPRRERAANEGREDDRALAQMLGGALLFGVGVTGGAVWGLWHAVSALAS